jgi:hypothetical protein
VAAAGDLSWSIVGDAGEGIGVSVADTAAGAEFGLEVGQDVAVFADAGAVIGLGAGNAGRVVTVAVAVEETVDVAVAEWLGAGS